MFNIHFTELLIIAVVALLVIGPEKLPSTVRTASLWIGRFRRSFYKVKADIERELNADEIRRQLHNESVMAEIEDAKSEVENVAKDTEKSISNVVSSDDFDPGAAKDSYKQTVEEQTDPVKEELEEVGKEVEAVGKNLYGSGKNPKLAGVNKAEPGNESKDDAEGGAS